MKVNVKKLHEAAKVPQYAKDGDAGLDLTATSRRMDPKGFIEYGTGLAFEIPDGHVGLIYPRSSVSKMNMSLANCVGVIDSGYRGEVCLRFKPATAGREIYDVGDRVGQLIIMPYPKIELNEVDDLSETSRGSGGFGSTGKTHKFINESGLVEEFTLEEELGEKNT